MEGKFVSYENAVFVFYMASLNGEITKEEFFKVKEILKRCKVYGVDSENLKEE